MSLIVLKSCHNKKEICLKPILDKKDKEIQVGVKWVDDNFEIEIRTKNSKYF